MRQDTRVDATTDIRRWLRALRPFLVLGGFVVVWWCLATGTAQASEGPHHDLGTTTKALGGTVDRVVHRTADRTVGHVQRATHSPEVVSATTTTVRHHVAPVREVVEETVEQTPVTSVVKPVVKTVAAQVAPVLEKAGKTLAKTPLGPVVAPVSEDVATVGHVLPIVGESAVLPGGTASSQVVEQVTSAAVPGAGSDVSSDTVSHTLLGTFGTFGTSSAAALAGQDQAAPSSPVVPGGNDHGFLRAGSAGAASAQSGAGSAPGAALCGTTTDLAPSASKTSTSNPAGRPTAGPAYPPSCSPD
jgi:hypothetical protein